MALDWEFEFLREEDWGQALEEEVRDESSSRSSGLESSTLQRHHFSPAPRKLAARSAPQPAPNTRAMQPSSSLAARAQRLGDEASIELGTVRIARLELQPKIRRAATLLRDARRLRDREVQRETERARARDRERGSGGASGGAEMQRDAQGAGRQRATTAPALPNGKRQPPPPRNPHRSSTTNSCGNQNDLLRQDPPVGGPTTVTITEVGAVIYLQCTSEYQHHYSLLAPRLARTQVSAREAADVDAVCARGRATSKAAAQRGVELERQLNSSSDLLRQLSSQVAQLRVRLEEEREGGKINRRAVKPVPVLTYCDPTSAHAEACLPVKPVPIPGDALATPPPPAPPTSGASEASALKEASEAAHALRVKEAVSAARARAARLVGSPWTSMAATVEYIPPPLAPSIAQQTCLAGSYFDPNLGAFVDASGPPLDPDSGIVQASRCFKRAS